MAGLAAVAKDGGLLPEDLVGGFVADGFLGGVAQARVAAHIGRAAFDPEPEGAPFGGRGFHVVMAAIHLREEPAGGAADGARGLVAEAVASVGHELAREQGEEAVRPVRAEVARENGLAFALVVAVALHAMAVEDGLDVAREVHHVGQVREGLNLAGRTLQREQFAGFVLRRLGAMLVAADATDDFAGAHAAPALHPLHGKIVLVQRLEEDLPVRGNLEGSGTVGLHGHGAKHALQREGAKPRHEIGTAAEVHWLGQRFEDEELLDVAALHAGEIAAIVNVSHHHAARRLGRMRARLEDALAFARHDRARLVDVAFAGVLVDRFHRAAAVHEDNLVVARGDDAVLGEGPRVAHGFAFVDRDGEGFVIRAAIRGDNRDRARVLVDAVAGREGRDDLARAGDGLGVEHDDVRVHVPEIDRGAGAVGIHRPKAVILDLAAIHVFPAHVKQPAIGQRPGRVVVLGVGRDHLDVAAVGSAAVDHADLSHPAIYPAFAARGDKRDVAVGEVGWLVVVELAGSKLLQAGTVRADLVEVVEVRAGFAVGEQNLSRVVMDLRITDGAALRVEQRGALAGTNVPFAELARVGFAVAGVGFLVLVLAVIADVRVPVRIVVARAGAEDEVFHVSQRASEGLWEQDGGSGFGGWSGSARGPRWGLACGDARPTKPVRGNRHGWIGRGREEVNSPRRHHRHEPVSVRHGLQDCFRFRRTGCRPARQRGTGSGSLINGRPRGALCSRGKP